MEEQAEPYPTWWVKNKRILISTIITIIIVAIPIAFALLVHWFGWDWTGLSGFNGISIATDIATTPQKITKTIVYQVYQPGKTLWDWLQLLIVPAVLAVAGYVINLTISRGEQVATQKRAKTEREIAEDNQRETALQTYIDKMSELILDKQLITASIKDLRTIAHVRTLTVLPRLDGKRKGTVLQFLYESGLINKETTIINLNKADLMRADLFEADLSNANLHGAKLNDAWLIHSNLMGADFNEARLFGADLMGADLMGANLMGANLSATTLWYANLTDANLTDADLTGAELDEANLKDAIGITVEVLEKQAKSLKGATMPDGSIHP